MISSERNTSLLSDQPKSKKHQISKESVAFHANFVLQLNKTTSQKKKNETNGPRPEHCQLETVPQKTPTQL
jgi:hypothetical protein